MSLLIGRRARRRNSSTRLLDQGLIALLQCSRTAYGQVNCAGFRPGHRGRRRPHIEGVFEGSDETVQIGVAKTATDLEAGEAWIYQHELLRVIAVEFGDGPEKGSAQNQIQPSVQAVRLCTR